MLESGVVNPDKRANGMFTMNEYSMACCMVAAMDETSSPMPTAASKKRVIPRNKVTNDPTNGMRNQSWATSRMAVACTMPMRTEGIRLAGHDLGRSKRGDQQLIERALLSFARHGHGGE